MTSRRSLRVTITLWVTLLAAIGLIATGIITAIVGTSAIRTRIDDSLAREIGEFRELAARYDDSDVEDLLRQAMEENVPDEHETFVGFLPDVTLVPSEGAAALGKNSAFRRHVLMYSDPAYSTYHSPDVGELRLAIMPVDGVDEHGAPERAHFVVAYFVSTELAELSDVVWVYTAISVLAILGVGASAWLISSAVLAPLRALRETTKRISGSDVSERIPVTGTDEVAELTKTVNSMLDRLESALRSQRDMLDDVGHELRTPITVVRGHLELLDPADPADIASTRALALDELDRMNELVSDMMTLAAARRPDFLARADVDLNTVVSDVIERTRVYSDHTIKAAVGGASVTVLADRHRLVQAMMQLVDNAAAQASTITIGCDRVDNRARLWVRDTGPGIPHEIQEQIFQRHVRGTTSYDGTGIGLAIVAAIAQAHEGRACITRSDSGGTTMVIELPAISNEEVGHAGAARRG